MLDNYNHAEDIIQAPEDLKQKTAQLMRQALQAPQEAQTKRRRPMVWKAAVSFVLVAVLAVGALALPQNFSQQGGQTKIAPADKQHSFSLVTYAATINQGSSEKVNIINKKWQAYCINWLDEDREKSDAKHHYTTVIETDFKVAGENIDTVTFSVSQGKFQKRVSIPTLSPTFDYQEYAKAHGLDSIFTTGVWIDKKGNPVTNIESVDSSSYFGYEAKQNSSYTIPYEDQTDFSKQYGYRMTLLHDINQYDIKQEFRDVENILNSTVLTVSVHFKDGTTATKEMKLARKGISAVAIEKDASIPTEAEQEG